MNSLVYTYVSNNAQLELIQICAYIIAIESIIWDLFSIIFV